MGKKKPAKNSRIESYLWMLLNVVVWGASFIAVKPALSYVSPTRFLFYRYVFAVIISLPIFYYYRHYFKKIKKIIIPLIGIELLGTTLALLLLYAGLQRTTAIEANLIGTTLPLFITLGGILFLKEKEEKNEVFGLSISFLGTILLVAVPIIINHSELKFTSFIGNILIIGSCFASMFYYLFAKKIYAKKPMFLISTLSFYVGLVTFFPLAILETKLSLTEFVNQIFLDFSHSAVWIASLYMAFFGSIIGLTAYYKGQDGIEASEASLFNYLQPLVAIPLAVLILNEQIHSLQLIALFIIFIGVYIAEKRKK